MLDRPRSVQLGSAALCFVLFGLLTLAVLRDFELLLRLDLRGEEAQQWAADTGWLRQPLEVVEDVFDTIGLFVMTAALAVFMWVKSHRRAAVFTVVVMLAVLVVRVALKAAIGRERPDWQLEEGLLSSHAFPSGHAAGIAALAGVLAVLVGMLVRRGNLRRLAYAGLVLLVVVVCLDRVLLGRHYPSDVIGGVLVGAGIVLVGLAAYSPLPVSHAINSDPLTPPPVPSDRNLAVILNPIKVEDVDAFKAMVTSMAAEAGWLPPRWHYTTVEDPGTGMAEQASVDGADLVLVCGGDGTVREVCAELAGTGIPVGIVPAGTGNLLARNLDVPLFIRAAVDVALTGQDRAIDMVEVSGDGFEDTHFMVMAGMGFDAAIMEGVNEDIKKKVGWIAYVFSGLKSLMFPAVRIEISIDGGEFTKHRARTVVVGNVGYLQAGMPLIPHASIDDGVLDVVILHPRKFLSWLPLAYRVLSKSERTDETIDRMTGSSVVLRTPGDTPRQLDGDSIGSGRELRMTCVHGRLLVRVPR